LLLLLSQQPFDDAIQAIRDQDTDTGKAFKSLKAIFEHTVELYSEPGEYLSTDNLDLREQEDQVTVQFANLAMGCLGAFEDKPSALSRLHSNFLEIVVPEAGSLSGTVSELFLSLKTQVFMKALAEEGSQKPKDQLAQEIFLGGLEEKLRSRSADLELSPTDQGFLASIDIRKDMLLVEMGDETDGRMFVKFTALDLLSCMLIPRSDSLSQKYPIEDFLQSLNTYLQSHLASQSHHAARFGIQIPKCEMLEAEPEVLEPEMDLDELSSFFEKTTSGLVQNVLAGLTAGIGSSTEDSPAVPDTSAAATNDNAQVANDPDTIATETNGKFDIATDYKELEALVAQSTDHYVRTTLNGLSPMPYQPTVPTSTGKIPL
jgi:protein TBF1